MVEKRADWSPKGQRKLIYCQGGQSRDLLMLFWVLSISPGFTLQS